MAYAKNKLSGSTNGRGIKVVAVATPGTAIHTAVAGTSDWDEIFIYAINSDTVTRTLTIEFGGAVNPDDLIVQTLPSNSSLILVVPGLILQNSCVVRAFADAANVVVVFGYVHNIT